MKSSTDKEALLLLTHLIEFVYRLLWGDLFTLPVGGGIGISLMVVLLFTAGIWFTLRTRLLPVRLFRDMIAAVCEKKQGIVASKIAAHAADIAKGIPHARDIDDKMGDARRVLDWDAQFACALDPETAKAIRDARLPEDDHSDTCSMCGKFCAVRSMNKALAGEYIDIL